MAAMPILNFNFSQFLEYWDVINDAYGSNNDYRHVIIKGQHLVNAHFVIDCFHSRDTQTFGGHVSFQIYKEAYGPKPFFF